MSEHFENSVVKFCEVARSQENKGIKKYGQTLNPIDNYDWLGMAIEEQVDGFKYLYAEQVKRDYVVRQVKGLLEGEGLSKSLIDCIYRWLDMLEGK